VFLIFMLCLGVKSLQLGFCTVRNFHRAGLSVLWNPKYRTGTKYNNQIVDRLIGTCYVWRQTCANYFETAEILRVCWLIWLTSVKVSRHIFIGGRRLRFELFTYGATYMFLTFDIYYRILLAVKTKFSSNFRTSKKISQINAIQTDSWK